MTQESLSDGSDEHRSKEKRSRVHMQQKVVIRRLPPGLNEESFKEIVDPLPEHDYMYFVKGDQSLGQHSFSRVYINFLNQDDILTFRDKFDGYVFLDSKGNEYPAVVEYAPCQKIPRRKAKKDAKSGSIEQDPDYLKFLESLQNPEVVTLPSAETYLPEIEAKEKEVKVVTPLIEFIKQRKEEKRRLREEKREERRKRELEKKRVKDEERRRRREIKERERERTNSGSSCKHSEKRDDSQPVKLLKNPERDKDDRVEGSRERRGDDTPERETREKRYDRDRERKERERKRRDDDRHRREEERHKREEERHKREGEKIRSKREKTRMEEERARRKEDKGRSKDQEQSRKGQKDISDDEKSKSDDKYLEDGDVDGRDTPQTDESSDEKTRDLSGSESDSERKDKKGESLGRSSPEDDRSEGKKGGPDPRLERRIRNKDRPSLEIYRPGMHRLRKTAGPEGDNTPPLSSSSPSPTGSASKKSDYYIEGKKEHSTKKGDSERKRHEDKKKSSDAPDDRKRYEKSGNSHGKKGEDSKSKASDEDNGRYEVRSMTFRRSISKEK